MGIRRPRSTKETLCWERPDLLATSFIESPNASRLSLRIRETSAQIRSLDASSLNGIDHPERMLGLHSN